MLDVLDKSSSEKMCHILKGMDRTYGQEIQHESELSYLLQVIQFSADTFTQYLKVRMYRCIPTIAFLCIKSVHRFTQLSSSCLYCWGPTSLSYMSMCLVVSSIKYAPFSHSYQTIANSAASLFVCPYYSLGNSWVPI